MSFLNYTHAHTYTHMTIRYQLSPLNFDFLPTSRLSAVVVCCCSSSSPPPPPPALSFLFSPFFLFPFPVRPPVIFILSWFFFSPPCSFLFHKNNPRRVHSSRMWRCIAGCLVPGVSKEHISIFCGSWSLDRCPPNTASHPRPPEHSIMLLWKPRNLQYCPSDIRCCGDVERFKTFSLVIPTKINAPSPRLTLHYLFSELIPVNTRLRNVSCRKDCFILKHIPLKKKLYIRHLSTRGTGFSKQRKYLQIRKHDADFLYFPSCCVKDKLKFCQYLIQHEAMKLYGWVQNLRYMADNLSSIDLLLIPALVKILFCQHCHNFLFLFVWGVWDAVRGMSPRHHKM